MDLSKVISTYYFTKSSRPEVLSRSTSSIYCHDRDLYGDGHISAPLLNESSETHLIWDQADPRFYDINGNGLSEIQDKIVKNIRKQGYLNLEVPNIFYSLVSSNGPEGALMSQGYYMISLTDKNYKAFCPSINDYDSHYPLLKAINDTLKVNTQALYKARHKQSRDEIYVSEDIIKRIWFYKKNGKAIIPNDSTIRGKSIQFYWPANFSSPYIKGEKQRAFFVKDDYTTNSPFPTHDKRIGCIPKF